MAIIRAFTTIEQSRKLAEILPLESADQTWARIVIAGANLDVPEELQYRHNGDMPFQYYSGIGIPCWSLATLLDVLPKIHSLKPILDLEECSIQYSGINLYIITSNPIDACYKMIIKLNELKLL